MENEKMIDGAKKAMSTNNGESVWLPGCGQQVAVYKGRVKNIPTILELTGVVFDEVADEKGVIRTEALNATNLINMVGKYSSKVFDVVHLLTDMSRQDIDNLEWDDAIILASSVWAVNQSFFLNRVLPALKNAGVPLFAG